MRFLASTRIKPSDWQENGNHSDNLSFVRQKSVLFLSHTGNTSILYDASLSRFSGAVHFISYSHCTEAICKELMCVCGLRQDAVCTKRYNTMPHGYIEKLCKNTAKTMTE